MARAKAAHRPCDPVRSAEMMRSMADTFISGAIGFLVLVILLWVLLSGLRVVLTRLASR